MFPFKPPRASSDSEGPCLEHGFYISGLSSAPYTIEASTNFINWNPIYTNTLGNPFYSDPGAGTNRNRSYRLRTP